MSTRGFEKRSLQNTKTVDWCNWIILICIAYQYLVNIERFPLPICHRNRDNFMFSRSYVSSSMHGHRYEFKDRFHANKPSFYGNKKCVSHQCEEHASCFCILLRISFALHNLCNAKLNSNRMVNFDPNSCL